MHPNILYFQVDNLGFGELSCYSGGPFRGTWTPRIDAFAAEGMRFTNFAPESQCTPSRSALMTGRHAIRSGNHSVPLLAGTESWGLVAWERTIADALSEYGYACAAYGKWHIGEGSGRWPTDHGFQEWYGIRRSYDESLWSTDPWYDPQRDPIPTMVQITRGDNDVTEGARLDLEQRRNVDAEYLERAIAFMRRQVEDSRPFYVYFNHSLMHLPCIPRKESAGKTGNGDWADCLLELDTDFGTLLDELHRLGVSENTIVVFAGDNGPEEMLLWRGTPGYWEGSYFAGGEGNLRTPCIVRWPGTIPPGRVSNEHFHITDWFPTLLSMADCGDRIPTDRVIDGIDQSAFLKGERPDSPREGFLYWMGPELYGVKWRNFKLKLIEQRTLTQPAMKLATPYVVNLLVDPQEREPFDPRYLHTWTTAHFGRLIGEFARSLEIEPLIPPGAPLDHVPMSHAPGA